MKRKYNNKILLFLLSSLVVSSCQKNDNTSSTSDNGESSISSVEQTSSNTEQESSDIEQESSVADVVIDKSHRVNRDFSKYPLPSNEIDEDSLPSLDLKLGEFVILKDNNFALVNDSYRLDFINSTDGKYVLQIVDLHKQNKEDNALTNNIMFTNNTPVRVYIKGSGESFLQGYDRVSKTSYGILASAILKTSNGSILKVEDYYYFPSENEKGVFNVRQAIIVNEASPSDTGFASEYVFQNKSSSLQWFVPNNVYKTVKETSRTFRETQLGAPMMMCRDSNTGNTLSLSRYQPIVNYEDNSFASLQYNNTDGTICIAYPSNEANRKYHNLVNDAKQVCDFSIRAEVTKSYETATSSVYNAHFNLQNQRIVNTDIDEVYKVINEDYKTFLHVTDQESEETGKKYKSYGLPWRITIEDGEFGPLTYQAGFIGQQIPAAYNMMLYGVKYNDLTSLQNGLNVIDFWVEDAEFMSVVGVPQIWYDTWASEFRAYPCFTRMAVDAMEGLLDAYRLAVSHGIDKDSWYEAIIKFGDFLVNNQNEDGSYYRCYNYDGGPFVNWDNGIEEPQNNICQSYSKSSSPMPIRFLGKLYEMTEDETYKEAALKAGEYVYNNIYLTGSYQGGTCDQPNAVDKEAGVFAMYAYDTLYTLTKDKKWLECLKQAAAFTMSTVLIFSFPVKESSLKSAYPLYSGYTDGMSFIVCDASSGVDNYISYIYYELFRIYIYTGDTSYLKQAEFIQQNTKSIMNWDGSLNYKYKSLVAEASSVSTFTYNSASNGAWVTWSSTANSEPIAKMYTNFGNADVMAYKDVDISVLQEKLDEIGCGGKSHIVYENDVANQVE